MSYDLIIELLPLALIGIVCGLYNFINSSKDEAKTLVFFIKSVLHSLILSCACYMILSAVELPYQAKVGISALIAFLGMDKAMEMVQKIMNTKRGV